MSDNFGERMAKLEGQVSNIEKSVSKVEIMLENFIKRADEKYATKESSWAEGVLRWIAFTVIGAVILGLLALLGLRQ